jgi:hypothetical protein
MEGKQREMGLGGLSTVDLARARMLARDCRLLLLQGKDPIEARNAERLADALHRARSTSFDQCAAAYIDAHRKGWKNAKHADQWKSTLATYASPVIGALARAPGKPARQSQQDRTGQASPRAALARGSCVHGETREVRRRHMEYCVEKLRKTIC